MGPPVRCAPVFAALLCVSCEPPAIDPSKSLVGAETLPPASELSRESINIFSGYDKNLSHQLSYELRPDDTWIVRISEVGNSNQSRSQRFQLTAARAGALRQKLWRVRPAQLNGVERPVRPADCPLPPTDISSMFSVVFIAEGPKPGVGDDRVGLFELPYDHACDTAQAAAARQLIEEVLKPLPGSKLRSEFRYKPPLP